MSKQMIKFTVTSRARFAFGWVFQLGVLAERAYNMFPVYYNSLTRTAVSITSPPDNTVVGFSRSSPTDLYTCN